MMVNCMTNAWRFVASEGEAASLGPAWMDEDDYDPRSKPTPAAVVALPPPAFGKDMDPSEVVRRLNRSIPAQCSSAGSGGGATMPALSPGYCDWCGARTPDQFCSPLCRKAFSATQST